MAIRNNLLGGQDINFGEAELKSKDYDEGQKTLLSEEVFRR